ncbi:MAG: cation diffusion facilitator family transporter [Holophaga sp.]|nr:cation diffusion facilitator family transporter [Holophaga sp.]
MDAPLPNQTARLRIAILSIVVGCVVLVMKYVAFHVSHSAALKSDAIENVVNVVAAVFALGSIIFADKPADREHPYGHGKIEHFSAAFEGGMISLAAVLIAYEAIQSIVEGIPIQNLSLGLGINFLAGLLNGLLGLFLIRQGKRQQSHALEADGHHVFSDFYVTLGLAAGLLLVKATGLTWLDPAMALVVCVVLALTGFKLVRSSSAALLDTEDPAMVQHLVESINKVRPRDIVAIHELRTLRSGRYIHVDIHMVIPEFYGIGQGHELADDFGKAVLKEAAIEGELHTHVDPCLKAFCDHCDVTPCPVRQNPQTYECKITLDEAVAPGPI